MFLERSSRGLDRLRRRRRLSKRQFQCESYLARDPDHPVAVVAAGERDAQTEEEAIRGNQVKAIHAHPQDRDRMKEDAGEEDATRPPFGLYPHVFGLRLISFLDQFVHPPNREIKEDPRDRPVRS